MAKKDKEKIFPCLFFMMKKAAKAKNFGCFDFTES